jgi:ParB-like chromosome segregation protein Spo0J
MNPKVEQWDIEKLIPYARNARTHSPEQVAQIAASIKEWGWTTPILVDESGQIIAGHGRTLAARKLGIKQVPVIIATGWTDAQKRAYIIADNKLALNAGWDEELLKIEFLDLGKLDFNLELTGFDLQEIASILDNQEEIQEPKSVEYQEVFNIIVECASEDEQEKIFNKLDAEGYKCRVQSL